MTEITIRPATGTWVVRAGGAVLGESTNALVLQEGSYDPVIYFPRDDIEMAFLDASAKRTHCPHKGDATYFSIVAKSGTIADCAWSYETPLASVAEIAGHLAFHTDDRVFVEQL